MALPRGAVKHPSLSVVGSLAEEKANNSVRERHGSLRAPSVQEAFTERKQELHTLSVRLRNDIAVDQQDREKYELELRNFHLLTAEEVSDRLGSSTTQGLRADQVSQLLARNGPNVIPPPKVRPMWLRFLLCFTTGFAPLLWGAAFFVFLAWKPFGTPPTDVYNLCLAIVLLVVILVSGLFTFHQDVKSSTVLASFSNMVPPECVVIRDGAPLCVLARDLVVGDLVTVQSGAQVPADMRMAGASRLKVDQSMLTGESEPVRVTVEPANKSLSLLQAPNVMLMGTNVVEGEGTGIVIATGADNQLSKIAKLASGDDAITTLQVEIMRFVIIIASVAAATGAVVIIWWAAFLNTQHKGFMTTGTMIANAISVIVAYVPEGLPLALSMGLAIIAHRLCYTHFVLLKRLGTIETLGSVSLIASDKTGTLTQNKMSVAEVISASGTADTATVTTVSRANLDTAIAADAASLSSLLRVATLCNQSRLQPVDEATEAETRARANTGDLRDDDIETQSGAATADTAAAEAAAAGPDFVRTQSAERAAGGRMVVVGSNGIDQALLGWANEVGAAPPLLREHSVVALVPFSSSTKTSSTVVRRVKAAAKAGEPDVFVLAKGAPEYLLARCTHHYGSGGERVELAAATRAGVVAAVEAAASQGQRLVALAELVLSSEEYPDSFVFNVEPSPNFPTDGLTFVACVAVSDPPRLGVAAAVGMLRSAGIKIAMVTGDAPTTAIAIARQVGIITSEERTLDTVERFVAKPSGSVRITTDQITLRELQSGAVTGVTHGSDGGTKPVIDQKPDGRAKDVESGMGPHTDAVLLVGNEVEMLTQEGWDFALSHRELVFARATPDQKLLLVREAMKRGERVGVTGDGVNDSPALKNADVGIAMAAGSTVARDAADMVLLDNEFSSVVHGVREGRLIFSNLRKVIGYQISAGCWSELIPVLATFFLGMPQPLSSILMILISCVTDVFAGVALMNELPEPEIMAEPPRDVRKSRLVDLKLVAYAYWFYANMASAACFINYFLYMANRGPTHQSDVFPAGYAPSQLVAAWDWGIGDSPLASDQLDASNTASSVYFVTIVVAQMGHLLSIRQKTPYFANAWRATSPADPALARIKATLSTARFQWRVLAAWAGSMIVAVFLTETPAIHTIAGTGSVPGTYWGIAFLASVIIFAVAEGRKWLIYLYPGKMRWTAW